jgi:predicted transglutaminase-like cysteine proteinase
MPKFRCLPLVAAAATLLACWSAQAAPASFMPIGGPTSQPVGHYELCRRMPNECAERTPGEAPIVLTRALWSKMIEVNNAVNVQVEPRTDQDIWGVEEYWSYPGRFGDCEDYVLAKRKLLMQAGVPAGDLLITVVRQPNGDGHAVLTVETSLGDYVLDNLEPRILPWTETDYQFLKRQSARNSGLWVSVEDGTTVAVGSVAGNR